MQSLCHVWCMRWRNCHLISGRHKIIWFGRCLSPVDVVWQTVNEYYRKLMKQASDACAAVSRTVHCLVEEILWTDGRIITIEHGFQDLQDPILSFVYGRKVPISRHEKEEIKWTRFLHFKITRQQDRPPNWWDLAKRYAAQSLRRIQSNEPRYSLPRPRQSHEQTSVVGLHCAR